MAMIDKSCRDFIRELASRAPVPGGGGAAAMGGAVGVALSNMVGNLTVGKKKYANAEPEAKELIARGERLMAEFQDLIDKDAEVFEPLSEAYRLPKTTPEEIRVKEAAMEAGAKAACLVPLEVMRKSCEGIKIHHRMGQIGSTLAMSDVGCGVVFLKAALVAASLNVQINTKQINDTAFVKAKTDEMTDLLVSGSQIADETLAAVVAGLTRQS